jgi:dipeptidyl aminopeptidase/acylaminoacyl peptidase
MAPDDIYELVAATDPRLSPDGATVAFVVTWTDRAENDYRSAIFLAPTDGSCPPRRLTSGEKRDVAPRWSPDGRELAFVSNRGGKTMQLYVLPIAGGESRRLTDLKESVREPAWSPDGRRIAFSSRVPDPLFEEEDERRRAPHRFTRLFFKLDDEGWIGNRREQLFVVAADGATAPVQLTEGDYESSTPAWSPDGERIVFSSARDEDWDIQLVIDLYSVAADGGEPVKLTRSDGGCAAPAWAPDGRTIAFIYTPGVYDVPRHAQIAVAHADGGEPRVLTASLDRNCAPYPPIRNSIWDGGDIVFGVEDGGNTHVYRVAGDGSAPERLVDGDLGVTGYDARDGNLVYTASTATTFSELYVGGEPLTRLGDAFSATHEILAPERFTAVSADGAEVEAWVVRPADFEDGRRYPVLLSIHGGPFTQYGNKLFDEFQVYAGAGYAVLYANPRGSSGYSEQWGRAIRGPGEAGPGWGTVDYDDLMAVVDEGLRRFDFCDPERLGVLGGSYGGYMTSWIVSHTNRFRAAASERAVNNFLTEAGSSDVAPWFKGYTGSHWFEDPETHLRISPATYAGDIHTPLLILHSENDLRCDVVNAEELFAILRLLRREVELVRFPAESHELSRSGSPQHRVQRFEIILDWFDRYLK